jgi:hypothetical protein
MAAGTIAFTVAETGQTTLTKTYNVPEVQDVTDAYQSDANTSINGTATRTQVWLFISRSYMDQAERKVQSHQTIPAAVPPPPDIS